VPLKAFSATLRTFVRSRVPAHRGRQAPAASFLFELHANRRRLAGTRFGGVANDAHEHVEQCIRIAFDVRRLERRRKVEIDTAIAQQAPLQREAGAHHAYGVEPAAAARCQRAGARALTHRAQHLRRAIEVFEHLTEVVQQRQASIRREVHPPSDRFHRELQSGARGSQRIAGLMDEHAGDKGGPFPATSQTSGAPRSVQAQALPARARAARDCVARGRRRWCGRRERTGR